MRKSAVLIAVSSLLTACALLTPAPPEPPDARLVQIRPALDQLPEALEGLRVELQQTPHPRINVHNPTGKRLIIRDHADQPFLHIGPAHARGNFANTWFHRARHATSVDLPDDTDDAPRWKKIDNEPAFSWWDPRLRITEHFELPPGITRGRARFLRRWRIPVRLGDVESQIDGYFLYQPSQDGVHRAALTNAGDLGEEVTVEPLLGETPGIFIANRSDARLIVKGIEGEPFLRFDPGRVLLNPTSVTWQKAAPDDARVAYDDAGNRRWVVIATTGGFGWHDPRAQVPEDKKPENDKPAPVSEWSIPVTVGGDQRAIEGRTWWLPQVTAGLR